AAPVPACVSPNRSEIASPAPLLPVPTLSKTDPPLPQVARRAQPVVSLIRPDEAAVLFAPTPPSGLCISTLPLVKLLLDTPTSPPTPPAAV
ncbi:hypothetical protein PHYSODRAFT_443232, partial [Phytophthora sojae]